MEMIDIIYNIANLKLGEVKSNGFILPGHNGPYHNHELPLRNSSHWIITYSYLYKITNESKYLDAVKKLADYIILPKNFGKNCCAIIRTDKRFDKTNGLIGQAWVIEGLLHAYLLLQDSKYLRCASSIFYSQYFDENLKFWIVNDIDGMQHFDLIFNHQLWFAAIGAKLASVKKDNYIYSCVSSFLDMAESKYFNVHENGCCIHYMNYELLGDNLKIESNFERIHKIHSLLYHPIKTLVNKLNYKKRIDLTNEIEIGYHLFDLYGFALLYQNFSEHHIFRSNKLNRAKQYITSNSFISKIDKSKVCSVNQFSYGYNSPAFEFPFVNYVLNGADDNRINKKLFDYQIQYTFDKELVSFCRNVSDSRTLDARIYEYMRYYWLRSKND